MSYTYELIYNESQFGPNLVVDEDGDVWELTTE